MTRPVRQIVVSWEPNPGAANGLRIVVAPESSWDPRYPEVQEFIDAELGPLDLNYCGGPSAAVW